MGFAEDVEQVCSKFVKYHDLVRELREVAKTYGFPRRLPNITRTTNSFCVLAACNIVFSLNPNAADVVRAYAAQPTRVDDFIKFLKIVYPLSYESYNAIVLRDALITAGHDIGAACVIVYSLPMHTMAETTFLKALSNPVLRRRLEIAVDTLPPSSKRDRVHLALQDRDGYAEEIERVCQKSGTYTSLLWALRSLDKKWQREVYLPIYGTDLHYAKTPYLLHVPTIREIVFQSKSFCVAAAIYTVFMRDHLKMEEYLNGNDMVRLYASANAARNKDLVEFIKHLPQAQNVPYLPYLFNALCSAKYYTAVAHIVVYVYWPDYSSHITLRDLFSAEMAHDVWLAVGRLPQSHRRDAILAKLRPRDMKKEWFAQSARAAESVHFRGLRAAPDDAKRRAVDGASFTASPLAANARQAVVDAPFTASLLAANARQAVVDATAKLQRLQDELETVTTAVRHAGLGLKGTVAAVDIAKRMPRLRRRITEQQQAVEAAEIRALRQEAHAAALSRK